MTTTEQEEREQPTEQKGQRVISSQDMRDICWGGLFMACVSGAVLFLAYITI